MNKEIKKYTEMFHYTYEMLALNFGYETRKDTKKFDFDTPNGKLMYATVEKIILPILEENKHLKKQLNYLKSGEYYNQLRFERDMLQDLVDKGEVSQEDKKFIDCTHRNNELLEENQQLKEQLEASEKARIETIHYIRTELLCYDNESIEYIEGLKILNKLDIDKGE